MASKLARQITQMLIAQNCVSCFYTNKSADVIDNVLQGKTISKKEVDRLQDEARKTTYLTSINYEQSKQLIEERKEAARLQENINILGHDLLRERQERIHLEGESDILAGWYVAERKNSHELQEKLIISVENEAQLRKQVEDLKAANHILRVVPSAFPWGWDSNYFIKEEPLVPPPCLKPRDARKWSEQTMFASEVKS